MGECLIFVILVPVNISIAEAILCRSFLVVSLLKRSEGGVVGEYGSEDGSDISGGGAGFVGVHGSTNGSMGGAMIGARFAIFLLHK